MGSQGNSCYVQFSLGHEGRFFGGHEGRFPKDHGMIFEKILKTVRVSQILNYSIVSDYLTRHKRAILQGIS
jgi:hypothetical protein